VTSAIFVSIANGVRTVKKGYN